VTSYSVFWGCAIPATMPQVEASARRVFATLGVELMEVMGATCCPLPEAIRPVCEEAWLALAGRNLALAARNRRDLMVICNGCFDTLSEARAAMSAPSAGKGPAIAPAETPARSCPSCQTPETWGGAVRVRHLVEVLSDDLLDSLRRAAKLPLGLRVAIQPGCRFTKYGNLHLLEKFLAVLEALGCEVVRCETEKVCCGFPATYLDGEIGQRISESRACLKLGEIRGKGVDCIAAVCPACINQLEVAQLRARPRGAAAGLPCLHLMELAALALGHGPDEIGLDMHRIKPARLLGAGGGYTDG